MLRQVSRIEPRISADGSRAVFEVGEGRQFTLHRGDAGGWKFHL